MANLTLPPSIRVRISSENAEGIGLSPVVAQDMATGELVSQILGVAGKDAPRVQEVLSRGSLVLGASRFRWASVECELEQVVEYLKQFPDPDPARPFEAAKCHLVVFRAGNRALTIEQQAGQKRRLLRKRSFWDELMEIARPEYHDYSYRERSDTYVWRVESQQWLGQAARLLTWSSYEAQLRSGVYDLVELFCRR
jgi:hypothetical protein